MISNKVCVQEGTGLGQMYVLLTTTRLVFSSEPNGGTVIRSSPGQVRSQFSCPVTSPVQSNPVRRLSSQSGQSSHGHTSERRAESGFSGHGRRMEVKCVGQGVQVLPGSDTFCVC